MDEATRFPCTLVHRRLFPAFLLDPFNPPKITAMLEVGTDHLSFLSVSSSGRVKILGGESFGNISNVTIYHLAANAQRREILQKSLLRMAIVGAIVCAYLLLFRTYGPGYVAVLGLSAASVSGSLYFLLNGGITIKNDVVRFHFTSLKGASFFLEVKPANELDVHKALLSAGLKFEGNE